MVSHFSFEIRLPVDLHTQILVNSDQLIIKTERFVIIFFGT